MLYGSLRLHTSILYVTCRFVFVAANHTQFRVCRGGFWGGSLPKPPLRNVCPWGLILCAAGVNQHTFHPCPARRQNASSRSVITSAEFASVTHFPSPQN